MNMIEIITKKRDGHALKKEEIDYLVQGYTKGDIPDYQMSALLMSIYFQKMNEEETTNLTNSMMNSGDVLDLSSISAKVVDKHSTGGVGDKTTLILGPLLASCKVAMAKMSGRGLGHTGGTIDKLESIEGFRTQMSNEEFIRLVDQHYFALAGQTGSLAPADKKIYALRDVTATVDDLSLIASSIMSKKLAAGANSIVLDVKTGRGAFMKEKKDAFRLAEAMVSIGKSMNRRVKAIVTDMNQPLGRAVGNGIEVMESMEVLKGKGPSDLTELCLALGAPLLVMAGKEEDEERAKETLRKQLQNGQALEAFYQFVERQGGRRAFVENPDNLVSATEVKTVQAQEDGVVNCLDALTVGKCALALGAGRSKKEDAIDFNAGVYLHKKEGEAFKKGDVLATLYANDENRMEEGLSWIKKAYAFTDRYTEKTRKLIYGTVE